MSTETTITDGGGQGYSGEVFKHGGVSVAQSPAVIYTTRVEISTTSTLLVAARAERMAIEIQNLDATNALHVVLGDATATSNDLRIGPREKWSCKWPPYTGLVCAIAVAAAVQVVVIEYAVS